MKRVPAHTASHTGRQKLLSSRPKILCSMISVLVFFIHGAITDPVVHVVQDLSLRASARAAGNGAERRRDVVYCENLALSTCSPNPNVGSKSLSRRPPLISSALLEHPELPEWKSKTPQRAIMSLPDTDRASVTYGGILACTEVFCTTYFVAAYFVLAISNLHFFCLASSLHNPKFQTRNACMALSLCEPHVREVGFQESALKAWWRWESP